MDTGTILVMEDEPERQAPTKVAVYARVSSAENKSNLDSQAENNTEDLLADLTSIIYSFCARLYGQRRAKRKTEKIVQELEEVACN
jgi:predicted site-specific integrase-resolvase